MHKAERHIYRLLRKGAKQVLSKALFLFRDFPLSRQKKRINPPRLQSSRTRGNLPSINEDQ